MTGDYVLHVKIGVVLVLFLQGADGQWQVGAGVFLPNFCFKTFSEGVVTIFQAIHLASVNLCPIPHPLPTNTKWILLRPST